MFHHRQLTFLSLFLFIGLFSLGARLAPAQGETAAPAPADPPLGLTWQFSILESAGDVGSQLSMAVQPTTGIPHIAYYSAENGLKLAARTGNGNCGPQNSWDCQLIAGHGSGQGAFTGHYPALAFRSDGHWGVVYQQESNQARFAKLYTSSDNNFEILFVSSYPNRQATGSQSAHIYNHQDQSHIWTQLQQEDFYSMIGPNTIWLEDKRTTAIAVDRGIWGNVSVAHATFWNGVLPSIFYAEQRVTNSGGNCYDSKWDCHHVSMVGSTPGNNAQTFLGLALYQRQCFFGTGALCDIPTSIVSYSRHNSSVELAEKVAGTDNRCYNGDPLNFNPDWRCTTLDAFVGTGPAGWLGSGFLYWPMGLDIVLYDTKLLVFYQRYTDTGAKVMMAYPADTPGTGSGCTHNADWHCVVVDDGSRGGGFVSVGFGLQAEVLPDGRILLAYHDLSNHDLIIAETVLPPTAVFLPFITR